MTSTHSTKATPSAPGVGRSAPARSGLARFLPSGEYRTAYVLIALLAVGAIIAQSASGSSSVLGQGILVLLAALGAYGLNLVTGYAGQASMGNGGFMAIGAMTSWYLGGHGVSFVLTVLIGAVTGFVLGGIVGAVALRWRGFYLILATLAVQYIVVFLIQQKQLSEPEKYQGGFSFEPATIGGHTLVLDSDWFVVIAIALALVLLLIAGLVKSPLGRAWMALRENENAASVAGVNVTWVKILAFAVGSGVISLGGALAGYYSGSVGSDSYPLSVAVSYVAMIIVGGLGSMAGPFLGACAITLIPYWVSSLADTHLGQKIVNLGGGGGLPYIQTLAYCIIVLLFLAFEPRGLASIPGRFTGVLRRRFGPDRHTEEGSSSTDTPVTEGRHQGGEQ